MKEYVTQPEERRQVPSVSMALEEGVAGRWYSRGYTGEEGRQKAEMTDRLSAEPRAWKLESGDMEI